MFEQACVTLRKIFPSHFHSLHLHPPWIGGVVEAGLHDVRDGLALREDLRQVLGAEDVAEGRGGQQTGGVAGERRRSEFGGK